ncbi:hypothetical protein EX895_004475 [Sporisorium graminicola]|uniref:Carrier domain-containing protein n=1 Tax=Sporisorium graminicola TaxID=280036 RepID=A0A4U7KQY4_9BASI|nr:hypothetical protein EX895_004475 [Sporisorium graminicola]TKY86834.1 hypothetical protein EX895_004475 [Sporisorium graminicola]
MLTTPTSSDSTFKVDYQDTLAVLGYALRVPGATSPSKLWDNIAAKRDLQQRMPANRYNVDRFFHPRAENKGSTNACFGYFLEQDLASFDNAFFNISGTEAISMDPQQRLALEVVYEAFESAGLPLEAVYGSKTGVFFGSFTNDYATMTAKDLLEYPRYTVTGTSNSILSNRISFAYNLTGPSVTVDTACSSSLVAFHLACQAVRNGDADQAVVVGSSLHFDTNIFVQMTDLTMLSTDGRCRAFDKKGAGYVRGEGVCALVVKRTSDAIATRDPIHAVIRATGSNHDGKKSGLTMPSSELQEALIRSVYTRAKLDPRDTHYFEAHGTGTQAGDPRETRAIGAFFGPHRSSDEPLLIGSIKTNIGHLEGASGLAGLIKAIMCVQRGKVLPNMHFEDPNPNIHFDEWKLQVPTQIQDWPETNGKPRRASINSFGFGGANAHVVVEQPPSPDSHIFEHQMLPSSGSEDRPHLLLVSAHSEKAAKLMAKRLADYIDENRSTIRLDQLAFSLNSDRRTRHAVQGWFVCTSLDKAAETLRSGSPTHGPWIVRSSSKTNKLGFIFTGQGAQHFAMARQMILLSPRFRRSLERFNRTLQGLPENERPFWDVITELTRDKEDSRLGQTAFSQPLCTAIQLALVDHLESWGIVPDGIVGHSSGEIAAAYAAGILSFEDAAVTAYLRGVHMSNASANSLSVRGGMMAVGMTEPQATIELADFVGRIVVACVNSPSSLTLAGDADALDELQTRLDAKKVFARKLQVAQAFHSHHMAPLAPAYRRALEQYGLTPKPPKRRMVSSVTAREAQWEDMGPEYWARNMTSQVRFSPALMQMVTNQHDELDIDALIEIGPHPALKGPSKQVLKFLGLNLPYVASLQRNVPDLESLCITAAQLVSLQYALVDLKTVNRPLRLAQEDQMEPLPLLSLPSYAWDWASFWAESRVAAQHRRPAGRHALLGISDALSVSPHPRWRNFLRKVELPWLEDHRIQGSTIFPAAGYIALAVEAALHLYSSERKATAVVEQPSIVVRDLNVEAALQLPEAENDGVEIITDLRPVTLSAKSLSSDVHEFTIFSFNKENACFRHARGLVSVEAAPSHAPTPNRASNIHIPDKLSQSCGSTTFYKHLHSLGLEYGPSFQLVRGEIESAAGLAKAELDACSVAKLAKVDTERCAVHPAVLDAAFHLLFRANESSAGTLSSAMVPTRIAYLKLASSVHELAEDQVLHLSAAAESKGQRKAVADLHLTTSDKGRVLFDIQGLECTSLGGNETRHPADSVFFCPRELPLLQLLSEAEAKQLSLDIGQAIGLFLHQRSACCLINVNDEATLLTALAAMRRPEAPARRLVSCCDILGADRFLSSDRQKELQDAVIGGIRLVGSMEDIASGGADGSSRYHLVVSSTAPSGALVSMVDDGGLVLSLQASSKDEASDSGFYRLFSSDFVSAWSTTDPASYPSSLVDPVVLLHAEHASDRTLSLIAAIKEQLKAPVKEVPWSQATSATLAASSHIISLVGIDASLFSFDDGQAAQKHDFQTMQRLLTGSFNIVWAAPGLASNASRPDHAFVVGMARTALNENDDLRFVTYDFADRSTVPDVAIKLLKLLDRKVQEDEVYENVNGIPHVSSFRHLSRTHRALCCNLRRVSPNPQQRQKQQRAKLLTGPITESRTA